MWVFLDRSAVVVHDERARVVRLEPDQLVGLIVELAEQNAIDLVPAVVASSHTCKRRLGGFVRSHHEEKKALVYVPYVPTRLPPPCVKTRNRTQNRRAQLIEDEFWLGVILTPAPVVYRADWP